MELSINNALLAIPRRGRHAAWLELGCIPEPMGIAERSSAHRPGLLGAPLDVGKGTRARSQVHSTGIAGGVAASSTNAGRCRSGFRGEARTEAISCCIEVC